MREFQMESRSLLFAEKVRPACRATLGRVATTLRQLLDPLKNPPWFSTIISLTFPEREIRVSSAIWIVERRPARNPLHRIMIAGFTATPGLPLRSLLLPEYLRRGNM
jgi:hypothetical protein